MYFLLTWRCRARRAVVAAGLSLLRSSRRAVAIDKRNCKLLVLRWVSYFWNSRAEVVLLRLLDRSVSSSLSSPPCNHLLEGRVDVLYGRPCLCGAGQDARHAFRDALCRGVRSPPPCAVRRWEPVQSLGHLTSYRYDQQTFSPLTSTRLCLWSPALLLPLMPSWTDWFVNANWFRNIWSYSFIDLTSETSGISDGDQSVVDRKSVV